MGLAAAAAVTAMPALARACLNAHHMRRVVLGSSTNGVVVLELDWKRTSDGDFKDVRLKGPARVGLLASEGTALQDARSLGTADVPDERRQDPAAAFKKYLRTGLTAARSYPGFRPAGMPRHLACDFERNCGRVRLETAGDAAFLIVARERGAPVRVPVELSQSAIDDAVLKTTKAELASDLVLVSVLSYDLGGREVLVVDLGTGEPYYSPGEQAIWPPCGCREFTRCPALATTMHHGSQFEVVIPMSTPPPPPPPKAAPSPRALAPTARELASARAATTHGPRTDGVYGSEPTCDPRYGWTRRFFRFLPDGTVQQTDGNDTPREAFRLTGEDVTWILPRGTYEIAGRRVSGTIVADPDQADETSTPRWRLDGIVEGDALRAVSASRGSGNAPMLFRFTPVGP